MFNTIRSIRALLGEPHPADAAVDHNLFTGCHHIPIGFVPDSAPRLQLRPEVIPTRMREKSPGKFVRFTRRQAAVMTEQ